MGFASPAARTLSHTICARPVLARSSTSDLTEIWSTIYKVYYRAKYAVDGVTEATASYNASTFGIYLNVTKPSGFASKYREDGNGTFAKTALCWAKYSLMP